MCESRCSLELFSLFITDESDMGLQRPTEEKKKKYESQHQDISCLSQVNFTKDTSSKAERKNNVRLHSNFLSYPHLRVT